MPQQICTHCINSLNEAIKFRATCEKTERSLLNLGFKKTKHKISLHTDKQQGRSKKGLTTKAKRERLIRRAKKKVLKTKKAYKKLKASIKVNSDSDNNQSDMNVDIDIGYNNTDLIDLYNKNPNNLNINNKKKEDIVIPESLKCNICEKILKNKHTYVRHMIVHTGDYPYMCEVRIN